MVEEFEARSSLQATVKINARHEGEVNNLTQEKLGESIKRVVTELVRDEAGEDDLPVSVSVYFTKFAYSDNIDQLRNTLRDRMSAMDIDQLTAILETLNND